MSLPPSCTPWKNTSQMLRKVFADRKNSAHVLSIFPYEDFFYKSYMKKVCSSAKEICPWRKISSQQLRNIVTSEKISSALKNMKKFSFKPFSIPYVSPSFHYPKERVFSDAEKVFFSMERTLLWCWVYFGYEEFFL